MQKTIRVTCDVTFDLDNFQGEPEYVELWQAIIQDPEIRRAYLAIWALVEIGCAGEEELCQVYYDREISDEEIVAPLVQKLSPEAQAYFAKVLKRSSITASGPFTGAMNPRITHIEIAEQDA